MDGRRFDTISRLLAGAGTRRGALKAALGLVAGGSALAAGEAAARPALCRPAGRYCTHNRQCCNNRCRTGKRVPIASRNICDCDAPQAMCGKMCRDLSSDPNHCGACGNQIDRETELCCDGVPVPIDEDNCHACGEVCGPDDICCGPEIGCAASCEPPVTCTDPGECQISDPILYSFCGVSVETCDPLESACGAWVGSNGNWTNAAEVPCSSDADCAAVAANLTVSGGSVFCTFGISTFGQAWDTGNGGACALYVTEFNKCG